MIEKLFIFAFGDHSFLPKRVLALFCQSFFKMFWFNINNRISFFSGIGAFSKMGSLQDFLTKQRVITERLKSSKIVFYKHLIQKSKTGKLYKALRPFYPPAEVSIFSAGEQANKVKQSCEIAVEFIKQSKMLKDKIKKLCVMVSGYLTAFIVFVVIFTNVVSGVVEGISRQLPVIPEPTQQFIDLKAFLDNYLVIILVALFVSVVLITYRLPRGFGKFKSFLHSYVPGFRMYRRYSSCTFLLSLAAMLGAGMSMKDAISVIGETNRDYMRGYTKGVMRKLNGGAKANEALDVGLLPKEMYLNVSLFIGGKDITDSLFELSKYELESLGRAIDRTEFVFKWLMMVIGAYLIIKGIAATYEPGLALGQTLNQG